MPIACFEFDLLFINNGAFAIWIDEMEDFKKFAIHRRTTINV